MGPGLGRVGEHGGPDGSENAQWAVKCHHPRVPSNIPFPFRNHQGFFDAIYFAAAPNSRGTKFQVFTTRFVKSRRFSLSPHLPGAVNIDNAENSSLAKSL